VSKYVSRIHTRYIEEIAPALLKTLGLSNVMEIPKIEKVVLNM
jgi:large subunit ribosomal protein L5